MSKQINNTQDLTETEQACANVNKLYNKGTNCDKAVLKVLQKKLDFPEPCWNLDDFYSENPDEDRFLCKGLLAGALAIYLEIIHKYSSLESIKKCTQKQDMEKVNNLFNTILAEVSKPGPDNLKELDPFELEQNELGIKDIQAARNEYKNRVNYLYNMFLDKFNESECQALLGFNPFDYLSYDEEMQEYIEGGEWMQNCCKYMEEVVSLLYNENDSDK